MRNAWKGLVVGALTGAAVGIAIDLADATARTAQRGAAKAADAVSGHSSEHHKEPEHPREPTRIRNAWKGLAVGGLTGAAVGIAIDFVDGTARTAQRGAAMATGAVGAHLPEAIDRTKEAATRATHYVADRAPDIAESAHKTARAALDRQRSELGPRGSGKRRSR
jgi:hypothetical protein